MQALCFFRLPSPGPSSSLPNPVTRMGRIFSSLFAIFATTIYIQLAVQSMATLMALLKIFSAKARVGVLVHGMSHKK